AIPSAWQEAVWAVVQASRPRMPTVTADLFAAARAHVCSDLGWKTRDGDVVRPADLTVAVATKLQSLDSHLAIAERHRVFEMQVQHFDMLQPGGEPLPPVTDVLARWWKVRVPNCFKEAAWRLTLDGHPTAARMQRPAGAPPSCCAACGAATPDFAHHFW